MTTTQDPRYPAGCTESDVSGPRESETPETAAAYQEWADNDPDASDRFEREFIRRHPDEVWAAILSSRETQMVYKELAERMR